MGGTLRIVNLVTDNAGVYRCEANGRQGVQYKDYNLNVIGKQTLIFLDSSNKNICNP